MCEPEPHVTRKMDLGEIADKWRAAFYRANCRSEIGYRNIDVIAASVRGDQKRSFIQKITNRGTKQPASGCDQMREMYLLELRATEKMVTSEKGTQP